MTDSSLLNSLQYPDLRVPHEEVLRNLNKKLQWWPDTDRYTVILLPRCRFCEIALLGVLQSIRHPC